ADQPNVVAQSDGVAQRVASGTDVDRAAAQIGHIVDSCLHGAVIAAADVAFVDADVDHGGFGLLGRSRSGDEDGQRHDEASQGSATIEMVYGAHRWSSPFMAFLATVVRSRPHYHRSARRGQVGGATRNRTGANARP